MFDVLIIHGSYGSPFENWFPWLHQSLSESGHTPLVPHFPTPQGQNYENWANILDAYRPSLSDTISVFAHSLGPAFITKYCIERDLIVDKCIFVAPFCHLIGNAEFDSVNASFVNNRSILPKFRDISTRSVCFFSDNDPYVPLSFSEEFSDLIGAQSVIISGGGHLNSSSGYNSFPDLLEHFH